MVWGRLLPCCLVALQTTPLPVVPSSRPHTPQAEQARPGDLQGRPTRCSRRRGGGSTAHCAAPRPVSTATALPTPPTGGGGGAFNRGKPAQSIYVSDTLMTPPHSVILQKVTDTLESFI